MLRKLTIGLVPGLLVLLFVYTGFTKVFALQHFRDTLYNQPFPHPLAAVLTYLIPTIELSIAAALLFNRTRKPALYAATGLLTLFTLYIAAILLHFFRRVPCSCGGAFRGLSWAQHFWINILLTGLTITTIIFNSKKSIPSPLNHLLL